MGKRNEKFDAYIADSADFARPILTHLREIVHTACPEIEETWKWSFPNFDYKGIVCSMAAFKQHCSFGFWKASLMSDPEKILTQSREAMGQMGQIKSLADLPPDDVLISYIREAVELNEKGIKIPSKAKTTGKKALDIPDYFTTALEENEKASETFENFSYSNKKEYLEWITEAKTEETRNKRMMTAIGQMAEGKSRHWKYARK
jgi:uncharacterized protein YdeI (YjbR/CyaY-like superfamily)